MPLPMLTTAFDPRPENHDLIGPSTQSAALLKPFMTQDAIGPMRGMRERTCVNAEYTLVGMKPIARKNSTKLSGLLTAALIRPVMNPLMMSGVIVMISSMALAATSDHGTAIRNRNRPSVSACV